MFITFEGANGCGKTTIVLEVTKWLKALGYKVCYVKTPTDTALGKVCRAANSKLEPTALACLLASDKYQCVHDEIKPKLSEGCVVLCDRFLLTAYTYNGMDGVSFDYTRQLYSQILQPDYNFVLELNYEEVKKNIAEREEKDLDRYEHETERERETLSGAIEYCKKKGDPLKFIPVTKNLEDNTRKIIDILLPIFKENNIVPAKDIAPN